MFNDDTKTMLLLMNRVDSNWGDAIQLGPPNGEGESWHNQMCVSCGMKLESESMIGNHGGGNLLKDNKAMQRNATCEDVDMITECEGKEDKKEADNEKAMYAIDNAREIKHPVTYNVKEACYLADEAARQEEEMNDVRTSNVGNEGEDVSVEDRLFYEFLNEAGLGCNWVQAERPAVTSCWEEDFRKLEDRDTESYLQIPNIPEGCTCDAQHCFPYCGCIFYAQSEEEGEEMEY
jgi:hypothetical protein